MSHAKLSIIGRIGSVKESEGKIRFSIAHNETREKTTWFQCFLTKKQSSSFSKFISKGDLIFVEGKPIALKNEAGDVNGLGLFPSDIMPVIWKKHNLEFTANDIPF